MKTQEEWFQEFKQALRDCTCIDYFGASQLIVGYRRELQPRFLLRYVYIFTLENGNEVRFYEPFKP